MTSPFTSSCFEDMLMELYGRNNLKRSQLIINHDRSTRIETGEGEKQKKKRGCDADSKQDSPMDQIESTETHRKDWIY